ncbi:MFS transporter [Streptomyces violaceusniger]|uniref:Major facilitator superfamily MFS_1 n=1 Tax=Streptomyces violaceusniger (strain Tu 4113) TaxID=653045 RepID=G2NZN5_STRV4|nr:MFS transporter [Streptomyces violaceusniger]AEM83658.1 major facilitator superfamily MFS_1 [Streptomyces violaceusniger Tu 4113]
METARSSDDEIGPTARDDDKPPGAGDGTPAPPPKPGWRRWVMDTRPLRHRPFRRLWTSTTVTAVGSQLTAVAVPKQIYDITGSSAWVGYASFAGLLPLVVFALWGGVVADRMDRRTLMLVTNVGIAVTSLLFWAQSFAGLDSVAVLMVLLAAQQGFFGMNSPARSASVARLVPADELPAAGALQSTVAQTGMIIGPLLAGALIPVLGLPTLYLLDAVALCITLWAVWRLPSLPPLTEGAAGGGRRAGWRDVVDGFRYIAAHRILLMSFLADIIAMVFGMPRALFPQLASHTYAPWGEGFALGLLFAAIPIGAVAGGLLSGTFSRARRHGLMVIAAVVAWGVAIAGFGLSPNLWWAVAFLALAGVADMVSMVFRGAILQSAATDDMRGRMQGVFTVVVAGGPRIADLLHGTAGSLLGARAAVAAGGLLVAVSTLGLAAAVPAFRRYTP